MGFIDKCGMRGDATLCVVIFVHVLSKKFKTGLNV